ncbi:MAG: TPM domain-containing protein, partial [Acidobacteriota bacterium]
MKRTRVLVVLTLGFVLLFMARGPAEAQTAQSPLPKPTGYVNDYAGVVDSATKERLETTLGNLERQQQIQFSVVTVDTTSGQNIFDYSLAVARGWGVGSKDTQKPSLLLLVAIKDRTGFTQVSRHLEGDLPDGLVGQIQREQLVPSFKAGQYGQGLADTIDTYIETIAQKRGFSTDKIFPAGVAREQRRSSGGKKNSWGSLVSGIFVIVVIVVFVLAIRGRGRGGRGGSGGGWLTWLLISSLMNSGRGSGSSGWGGGGFGGFGGGG